MDFGVSLLDNEEWFPKIELELLNETDAFQRAGRNGYDRMAEECFSDEVRFNM